MSHYYYSNDVIRCLSASGLLFIESIYRIPFSHGDHRQITESLKRNQQIKDKISKGTEHQQTDWLFCSDIIRPYVIEYIAKLLDQKLFSQGIFYE